MPLTKKQNDLCAQNQWDFSDLTALFFNCTLKKSPERSNTRGLMDIPAEIMRKCGVSVEFIRPVDYAIAHGVHVRILTDLVAGVAAESSEAALAELAHAGAELATGRG